MADIVYTKAQADANLTAETVRATAAEQAAATAATNAVTAAAAKYAKPVGGIPAADLTSQVQTAVTRAASAILTVNGTTPDGSGNVTVPAATAATGSAAGIVQLAGDLAGTSTAPTVPGLAQRVPTSRTVAGKPLTADVTLTPADIDAAPSSTTTVAQQALALAQANGSGGASSSLPFRTLPLTPVKGAALAPLEALADAVKWSARYHLVTWLPGRNYGVAAWGGGQWYDLGLATGAGANAIKPVANVADLIADTIVTGNWVGVLDASGNAVTEATAAAAAVKLLGSAFAAHVGNGATGNKSYGAQDATWQAGLWLMRAQGALMKLKARNPAYVSAAVDTLCKTATASEADWAVSAHGDGMAMRTSPLPVTPDPSTWTGNSRTDENTWMVGACTSAYLANPADSRAATWLTTAVKCAILSLAWQWETTNVGTSQEVVNGIKVGSFLNQRLNLAPNGAVINHDVVTQDYGSTAIRGMAQVVANFRAAGLPVPRAFVRAWDRCWRALTQATFPVPPYNAAGGFNTGTFAYEKDQTSGTVFAPPITQSVPPTMYAHDDQGRPTEFTWGPQDQGFHGENNQFSGSAAGTAVACWIFGFDAADPASEFIRQFVGRMRRLQQRQIASAANGGLFFTGFDSDFTNNAANAFSTSNENDEGARLATAHQLGYLAQTTGFTVSDLPVGQFVAVNAPVVDTVDPVLQTFTATARTDGSGIVDLAASATDNVAVASYILKRGTTTLSGSGVTFSDTGRPLGVTVSYSGQAVDTSGRLSNIISVTVTPTDTVGPAVSGFTATNGQTAVTGTYTVSDLGGVGKIEFLLDGAVVTAATITNPTPGQLSGSYSLPAVSGSRSSQVRVTDTTGNVTSSSVITVAVSNADTSAPVVTAGTVTPADGALSFPVTVTDDRRVQRVWVTDNTGGATVFDTGTLAQTTAFSQTVTITGLTNGTAKTYIVHAFDGTNETTATVTGTPAGATVYVDDPFSDASGVLITSRAGASGVQWSVPSWSTQTNSPRTDGAGGCRPAANTNPTRFTSDIVSPITAIRTVDFDVKTLASSAGMDFMADASTGVCYRVQLSTTGNTLQIQRISSAGGATNLGTATPAIAVGSYTVRVVVTIPGDNSSVKIDAYLNGATGTPTATGTDTAGARITTAGRIGGFFAAGSGTDTDGIHISRIRAASS